MLMHANIHIRHPCNNPSENPGYRPVLCTLWTPAIVCQLCTVICGLSCMWKASIQPVVHVDVHEGWVIHVCRKFIFKMVSKYCLPCLVAFGGFCTCSVACCLQSRLYPQPGVSYMTKLHTSAWSCCWRNVDITVHVYSWKGKAECFLHWSFSGVCIYVVNRREGRGRYKAGEGRGGSWQKSKPRLLIYAASALTTELWPPDNHWKVVSYIRPPPQLSYTVKLLTLTSPVKAFNLSPNLN